MKAKLYNFVAEFWSYEWPSAAEKHGLLPRMVERRADYDYIDVLILKELATDATRQLITIAKKLGVKYKTLAWHYKRHVMAKELIGLSHGANGFVHHV